MSTPRQQRQALRFMELGLVVAIMGVVITVALGRVADLQARVEAYAVRADIDALRTAVTLAWLTDREQVSSGMDPRAVMVRAGYGGPLVTRHGNLDEEPLAAPGQWYYDPDRGTLNYRPAHPGAFPELEPDSETPLVIRVRVSVQADGAHLQVDPPLPH